MLVSLQSHVSVFNRVESDQSFSVTPSLGAQTQCHSAPVMRQTELLRPKRNVTVHHLPSAGPLTRYWQPPSPLRINSTFDRQHKQRYKGAKQQFRRKCKTRRMCGFASSPPCSRPMTAQLVKRSLTSKNRPFSISYHQKTNKSAKNDKHRPELTIVHHQVLALDSCTVTGTTAPTSPSGASPTSKGGHSTNHQEDQ